jgi:hypothetical protein
MCVIRDGSPPVVHCSGDLSVITGSNDCQWRHDGRTSSIKNKKDIPGISIIKYIFKRIY